MGRSPRDDSSDSPATLVPASPQIAGKRRRDAVDAFCAANRAWALRQAKRSYRHLPEALREQAVDRAMAELRSSAPASTERRVLAAELAERLTEALRHVHVGWCLNESGALLSREDAEPVPADVRRDELADFVDTGLGGLERAVLQLEIGAGRDTRTTRAALRLHPRAYASHRSAGLSKLRDAVSAAVVGRACDQHVAGVVDAAMGDRQAMDVLASGSRRCRSCAREAQGLRGVLHERLAVAPWPLAIKPAGLLAAKLGVVGAVFGGKSAGVGTGAGALAAGAGGGSGATAAATVLAAAALVTGTATFTGSDTAQRPAGAGRPAVSERMTSVPAAARPEREPGADKPGKTGKAHGETAHGRPHARRGDSSGGAPSAPASTAPSGAAPAASPTTVATVEDGPDAASGDAGGGGDGSTPAAAQGPVSDAAQPATDAADGVVDQVTDAVPSVIPAPVQTAVAGVTDAADDAADAVDGVLQP